MIKEFELSDADTEFVGYKPVNFTKSAAGDRKIYLVDEAMKIDSILVSYCKKLNISTKVDSGLNINTIREFAGHEDERITFNNYTFNRLGHAGIESVLEKSLSKFNSCNII